MPDAASGHADQRQSLGEQMRFPAERQSAKRRDHQHVGPGGSRDQQYRPYPRTYLRNPWIANEDLSVFKNIPFSADGKRYLQLRLEAFNASTIRSFRLQPDSNVTNGAGAPETTFSATSPAWWLRTIPGRAGSTAVLGTYFGSTAGRRTCASFRLPRSFILSDRHCE